MSNLTHTQAVAIYEEVSAKFTDINRRYNTAIRKDELTDELELEFMRAEKYLKASYREVSRIDGAERLSPVKKEA